MARWRQFVAVTDIDLQIRTGEFVCIIGPSGCGKKHVAEMAAGLLTPSEEGRSPIGVSGCGRSTLMWG